MRVLFVYPVPSPSPDFYVGYSHGIGYLSAVLKQAGHETRLLCTHDPADRAFPQLIDEFQPQLIGFSVTTLQMPLARSLIEAATRHTRVPIIMGGTHPTVAPEDALSVDGVMGICRGEGEDALLEFVNALSEGRDYRQTRGFWFKEGERVVQNPPPDYVDLQRLPFPDRSILDFQAMVDQHAAVVGPEFMASRGCPFQCTYCINPFLTDLAGSRPPRVRRRSVENVLREVEAVTERYQNIAVLGFHDDIFTLHKAWLREFCAEYARRFSIPFWCNSRVDCITPEDVAVLRKAGCKRVHMAVETGNDFLRKEILGRDLSKDQITEAFRLLKQNGIKTMAFNMIGLPFETEDTIRETIELNRAIRPHRVHVTVFQPFPGTELHSLCREKGWLTERRTDSFYVPEAVLEQPSISAETVRRYYRDFVQLVYSP